MGPRRHRLFRVSTLDDANRSLRAGQPVRPPGDHLADRGCPGTIWCWVRRDMSPPSDRGAGIPRQRASSRGVYSAFARSAHGLSDWGGTCASRLGIETMTELARGDCVSLNQFIAAAVTGKADRLGTADLLLKARAATARPRDLLNCLHRVPNVAPRDNDATRRGTAPAPAAGRHRRRTHPRRCSRRAAVRPEPHRVAPPRQTGRNCSAR